MRIWNALSAKCPRFSLLKVHQQGAIGDVGHEVGGRAQSALAADELGGGRLSESADATDA